MRMHPVLATAALAFAAAATLASCGGDKTTLSNFRVIPEVLTVAVGATAQYKVTAVDMDGTEIDLTGRCEWTSADTAIATVDGEGVVTGVAEGSTNINATLDITDGDPDYEGFNGNLSPAVTVTP